MYVCLSVCLSDDNFRTTSRRKFISAHPVYLHAIRVKFVYEGYRVKVKVKITGLKRVANDNVYVLYISCIIFVFFML